MSKMGLTRVGVFRHDAKAARERMLIPPKHQKFTRNSLEISF